MTVGSKKIVIPGGSGFIGSHLARHFSTKGAELSSSAGGEEKNDNNARTVWWDGANLDTWAEELDGADVVINLAGRTRELSLRKKESPADLRLASFPRG